MGARRGPSGNPPRRGPVGSSMPTRRALLFIAAAAAAGALASGLASAQAQTPSPGAAAGALSPEASAAFARAAAKYSDGSAHACPFVQIYTPAGFTTARRESGQIWIQAPQRVRFDYTAPEKKTFTYDAGEGRLFTPEDKQLSIQKLTAADRARLPIVFLSDPSELLLRVRWLAIVAPWVKIPLAISGGVHTALDAIKSVMAGASAVQVVSALLKRGPGYLRTMRDEMERWMEEHEYVSLRQMRGSMSLSRCPDPNAFSRANYMRILQSWRVAP